MATKGSLQSCVNIHGKGRTEDRLPASVKTAVEAGRGDLARVAMEAHIAQLKAIRTGVKEQHKQNRQVLLEAVPATRFTSRPEDPSNELNEFKPVGGLKLLMQNLVQRAGSIYQAAARFMVLNPAERNVLNHFDEVFDADMSVALDAIFRVKEGSSKAFRHEDMIQYFAEHDADAKALSAYLDPAVKEAISATVYEWLGNDATRTAMGEQSQDMLRELLGWPKDSDIPKATLELLEGLGTNTESLAKALGRTVLERLAITPTENADALGKSRLEMSLGLMAIAGLEQMGVVERQDMFIGAFKKLQEYLPVTHNDLFYSDAVHKTREGSGYITSTVLRRNPNDNAKPLSLVEEIEERLNLAPDIFEKLFNNEPQTLRYSFGKIPLPKTMRAGRTVGAISPQQHKNIQNYVDTEWTSATPSMSAFEAMDALVADEATADPLALEAFGTIFGKESMAGKLLTREKSVQSINKDVDRTIKHVRTFLKQAKAADKNTFFILSDFISNMRMLMRGYINPQNSKVIRNLFAPSSWKVSFAPEHDIVSFVDKQGTERAFFEAVAQALDIESAKYNSVEGQLEALNNLFNHPENLSAKDQKKHYALLPAIEALQEFDRTKEMTTELMQAIAVGVEASGMKLHGFKGLQEYARYLNHAQDSAQPFTTDLYKEIDGVSNGPTMLLMMLLSNKGSMPGQTIAQAMQEKLAALAMAGVSVSRNPPNLDTLIGPDNRFLNDAYQRMGQEWAKQIELLKDSFVKDRLDYQLDVTDAIGEILGSFSDESGVINKIVRNLSKPRTMQTTFGAGLFSQSKLFADVDLINDGIYAKIEKIAQDYLLEESPADRPTNSEILKRLDKLLKNINVLLGKEVHDIKKYLTPENALNIDELLKFKFKDLEIAAIETAANATYGKAMSEAVNIVYAPVIEARKTLLDAINVSVVMYNTMLKAKVEAKLESKVRAALAALRVQKGELHPKDEAILRKSPKLQQLTKKELAQILEELEPLMPKIPTPINREDNPSYLQLVSSGKDKLFAKKSAVEQNYQNGTVVKHKGTPEGIPFLDPPGVAPIIRIIHMLDSMIANHLMGLDIDILNNHDGFSHRITDSGIVGKQANQEFFRIMNSYSMGEEIVKMHESTLTAARKMAQEMGIKSEEVLDSLIKERAIEKELAADLITEAHFIGKNPDPETRDIFLDKQIKSITQEASASGNYKTGLPGAIKSALSKIGYQQAVKDALIKIGEQAKDIAQQVTDNKKALMPYVTRMAQYSNSGFGYDPEGVDITADTVLGVNRDTVTAVDADNVMATAAWLKDRKDGEAAQQNSDTQGSSQQSPGKPLEADYPNTTKVDALNVAEVLETVLQQDAQAGYGSVAVSPDHKNHLVRVMNDIVARVMTPIQLFIGTHKIDQETHGLYVGEEKKIWLQTQQLSTAPKSGMLGHGIRMSAGEVYAHEIVHHIIQSGYKLSPYLRGQATNLYELARDTFETAYGANAFRVFMNDPEADITDPNNSFEVLAAKERWAYIFAPDRNTDGSNRGVAEFLAFGLTNENFKRALATLEIPPKKQSTALFGVFEKNIQQSVVNLFNKIMDFIHTQFYKQQHATQADVELENLVRALSEIDVRAKSGIYATFVKGSDKVAALGIKVDDKVKETATKIIKSRKVGQLVLKVSDLHEADNYLSYQTRRALNWMNDKDGTEGFMASVMGEVRGLTPRLQTFHEMLGWRKRVLDTAKVEVADGIRAEVNSWLKPGVTAKQKEVYTRVGLKTDLSSLLDSTGKDVLIDLVGSEQVREDRIAALMLQLLNDPALRPHRHFFEKAADDLGYYMIHGARRADGVPLLNAHNIAVMDGLKTAGTLKGEHLTKAITIIDELATLSSLRYVPTRDRQILVELMQDNWQGFENILVQHNLLKAEALKETFHNQPGKMQKGYIKQILNDRVQYEQGTIHDQARFTRMGYTMEQSPIQRDPNDLVKEDIYMFKSLTGTINPLQSGITSLTTNTKKGSDALRVQEQIGNFITAPAKAEQNEKHLMATVQATLEKMYKSTPRKPYVPTGAKNYVIPHYDDKGRMLGTRYMMNEHTKDTVLQQFSEVDAVLGAMASQIVDKKMTPVVNKEVVSALKDFYDAQFEKYPLDFVDISPTSTDKDLREIYFRLPDKMRAQIKSVWGRDGMMVSRDMITLAFGQNKYSITEVFSKNSSEQKLIGRSVKEVLTFALGWDNPFYKSSLNDLATDSAQMRKDKQVGRAVVRAKRGEEFLTQLTSLAKSNIVVRNLKVIHGNYLSNIALLLSHGVPIHEILKGSREAINSALLYQSLHQKFTSATIQRNILAAKESINAVDKAQQLKVLDRNIARLEDELARNPSKAMIEAGLLPSIVDDVDTVQNESPYTYGLDKGLDTLLKKMPAKMEKAIRVLFMTQDTEGFRMMNNAVKMTDYVGRYVMYKHLTQKKGMEHRDAVATVVDKFINFDLPTHKSIEYANSIGLVFFSKYQLRVLKHIKNVLLDAPFTALSVFLLGSATGVGDNIINSIPGVTKGLFQNIGTAGTAAASSVGGVLYIDLLSKLGSGLGE